ncbi:hypothetical protein BST97_13875 [Nonlabens spongiae]|uniref:Uncharacterized protein n=1 Tax=Nonlabens spongiae TaxID=331648 RepID=A0A1W6MND2_9FLAO|nr:hypothetical protein [Nonlabens spongiae]ARN78989.1 hypothetical protein BST97_13875 [Nonlabens spongiae]
MVLYFDPGLGAMITQAAIAAFAGFVLFYKTVIATIKGWLGMKTQEKDSFDEAYSNEDEDDKS